MSTLYETRDVVVTLGKQSILNGVSFAIEEGKHVVVEGPSGSGKSTLLNTLAQLIEPDEGELLFRGKPLATYGPAAQFRGRHIGFLFQDFNLIETLSVAHNIGLVQALIGDPAQGPTPEELLSPLGLGDRLHSPVSVLSRGERQRVALARAFANRPALVLADEPTASLDPSNREKTMAHLWNLCSQTGATLLAVSHDPVVCQDTQFAQRLSLHNGSLAPRRA